MSENSWKADVSSSDRPNRYNKRELGGNGDHGFSPNAEKHRVRSHYNELRAIDHRNRNQSEIFNVRNCNNLIKNILIDQFTNPKAIVLDLACGKGGDLQKWLKASISGLIGVDIADVSVKEAQKRYDEMHKHEFWVDFIAGDGFATPLEDLIRSKPGYNGDPIPQVDTVSCQFAIHYAFASEQSARKAMEIISDSLKKNGTFIGTTTNSEYLAKKLLHNQEWGNSKFQIRFEEPNTTGVFEPPYGHKYTFRLKEAVEDIPEYVVEKNNFINLAKEYGLECLVYSPFEEFLQSQLSIQGIAANAAKRRLLRKGSVYLPKEELDIVNLYSVFVFRKVRNVG